MMIMFYPNMNTLSVVELLIKSGTNINPQDKFGWTALMIFIKRTEIEFRLQNTTIINIVKLFLENGADIYLKNNDRESFLSMLLQNDDVDDIIEMISMYHQNLIECMFIDTKIKINRIFKICNSEIIKRWMLLNFLISDIRWYIFEFLLNL